MKKLILSTLLIGAASQAAGCIIVTEDDNTGDADVSWTLLSADQNGNPIPAGCPAGATSAIIYALPDGAAPGDAYIDKYDCAALGGTAADLPEGRYLVWVRLTDSSENTLYAESGSLVTDIVQGAITPVDQSIFVDHAFYQLSWTLAPGGSGSANCSQISGENGVSVASTGPGGGLIDDVIDCEEGLAPASTITSPWPSSLSGQQYTISVALLNQQNQSIGTAPPIAASPDRALNYGNEYVDLGTVNIAVQ